MHFISFLHGNRHQSGIEEKTTFIDTDKCTKTRIYSKVKMQAKVKENKL